MASKSRVARRGDGRGGGDGEMRAVAAAAAVVKWQNGGQDCQGGLLESTALSVSGNIAVFVYGNIKILLTLKMVCAH